MLILKEPIAGCDSYTCLQLVPQALYNTIFVAFHANAIGGHLNAYKMLHRIRLRYYWPAMWAHVRRMCHACPGCALSNPTRNKSSELVYGFPIEVPFLVMHFDAYSAGKHSGFEGSLPAWSLFLTHLRRHLHLPSQKSSCGMGSATLLPPCWHRSTHGQFTKNKII